MTVVDASVAIKWFVDEPDASSARKILASGDSLSAPSHLMAEVGRGLLRHKRSGDLSADDARLALRGLPAMVSLAAMDPLAVLAFDIANACSITIYDAFYVALAESTDDILVTVDGRLCQGLLSSAWAPHFVHLNDWSATSD